MKNYFFRSAFNRTLWNWNIKESEEYDETQLLLIEPYGIEIRENRNGSRFSASLLIEPYGIEIRFFYFFQV